MESTEEQLKIPEGWRALGPDELLKEGDKWRTRDSSDVDIDRWVSEFGHTVTPAEYPGLIYIRETSPAKADSITLHEMLEASMASPSDEEILIERGKIYGDPQLSHANIGKVWSGILGNHMDREIPPIPPEIVAQMMVGLKMVRSARVFHADNYVDARNYLGFSEAWQQAGDN
jgi:hypothetical protein